MADEPTTNPAPAEQPAPDNAQPQAPPMPDNVKSYTLARSETEMLVMIQQNQASIFSIILSHIASERLGYNLTANTQFVLDPQLKEIKIGELEPAEGGEITAAAVPPAPTTPPPAPETGSPVTTSEGGQIAETQ